MNADIINKIKALLSKTTEAGCTEAESQAAVAMANKLITQHNISLDEIRQTEKNADTDTWGEGKIYESGKYTLDISLAVKVIEDFFFVKHIMFKNPTTRAGRGFKLCFYGKKENVITAKYVFDGLMFAFDNLWSKYRRNTGCEAKYRRTFIFNLAKGFGDKLKIDRYNMVKEMDAEKCATQGTTALAIRNIQEHTIQKFHSTYPNLKSSNINFSQIKHNSSVAQAGYNAGRKLNINRPISDQSNRKAIR